MMAAPNDGLKFGSFGLRVGLALLGGFPAWRAQGSTSSGFRVLGFRGLGFRVLGFGGLGFRVLGFRLWCHFSGLLALLYARPSPPNPQPFLQREWTCSTTYMTGAGYVFEAWISGFLSELHS